MPESGPDPEEAVLSPPVGAAGSKGGRSLTYTDEVGEEICALLAEGVSLATICKRETMPGYRTVMRWLNDERMPGFRQLYALARELQGAYEGDRIADLAYSVIAGALDYNQARVAGDLLKWSAARKAPRKFGDRLAVDAQITAPNTGVIVMPPLIEDADEWSNSDLPSREVVGESPAGSAPAE